jgi:beta-N-acetylhexosaminidase
VRALEAGADTLLMPADPDVAIRAVVAAVQSGRLTRTRIQESVVKILAAKERTGLDRKRFADLEGISDVVDSPEDNARAQEIADRAVTLVRNTGGAVPLAAPISSACFVVMPEGRYSAEGPHTHAGNSQARARCIHHAGRFIHDARYAGRSHRQIADVRSVTWWRHFRR